MYHSLPFPDFITPKLQDYIKRIEDKSGRVVVFVRGDGAVDPSYEGKSWWPGANSVSGEEDPVALIAISNLTRKNYAPRHHDPIIAHEVTHTELYGEGWPLIRYQGETLDPITDTKLSSVQNWLQDPIINRRIHAAGFSMVSMKTQEIKESTAAIRKGTWTRRLADEQQKDVLEGILAHLQVLRLYLHFYLEPHIGERTRTQFLSVFRARLPAVYEDAQPLEELIDSSDWTTQEGFQETATRCLDAWGIDTRNIAYDMMEPFSVEIRKQWASNHLKTEAEW